MYSLFPAGYLLLQQAEEARASDPYRRDFGIYFGVDRLPPLSPTDPAIGLEGIPGVQSDHLTRVINEWLDSCFGNTAFFPIRKQALRLLKDFQNCGLNLELVYCQLAWEEAEQDRLIDYPIIVDPPPGVSLTYGFDASWPSCNHSVIFQPGVVPRSAVWRSRLNKYGLLDHYEDAVRLREEYVAIYPYPPFDIYLIHRIEQGE